MPEKNKNYGIVLMRPLLAFAVVGAHFSSVGVPFKILSPIAVPCFMMVSFLFLQNKLTVPKLDDFIKRIKALLFPYLIWPFIYLFAYSGLYVLFERDLSGADWKSAVFLQVLFGHAISTPLWFHWCLILLTCFAYLFAFIKNRIIKIICFVCLFIIAFFAQYSGLNNIFSNLMSEVRYPLGRIAEMVPYCIIGGGTIV